MISMATVLAQRTVGNGSASINGQFSTHGGKCLGSPKKKLRQHEYRSGYVWKKYLGATIFHEVQNLNGFETLSD